MEGDATFTARAGLVVVGLRFQQLQVWDTVAEQVHIQQKVREHTPLDKLLDCLINILAGGHGLVEINTRVRPDIAVQRAFGRKLCAEQSTISDTLSSCQAENVHELRQAVEMLLRQHGQSYGHDYAAHWQLFDMDMLGLPAGRLCEGATKGYFAGRRSLRGRQVGRVVAATYQEVLVDRLYDGKRQLEASLPELIERTEQTLHLSKPQQNRAVWRVDGGGGTDNDINHALDRGYYLLIKIHNWQRAVKLAQTVPTWIPDPRLAERQVGWVGRPHQYVEPTRQVAVRKPKRTGPWMHHVIVSNLSDAMLFEVAGLPPLPAPTPEQVALAMLYAYDQRGGGVETQNRNDKQGLGLAHRNKRGFAAQEMLVLLAQLAHNLLIWLRNDLVQVDPRFAQFAILRLVRDVLTIPGCVWLTPDGRVTAIRLTADHPFAPALLALCKNYFKDDELSVYLGQN